MLVEAVKARGIALDSIRFEGIIRWREIPFETGEEYKKWWLPLRDESGRLIRAALMSEREKDRYTVCVDHNLLTTLGRNIILTYLASQTIYATSPFSQQFAVGTFPIINVFPGDTSVQGEIFRTPPSAATITGTQIDISAGLGNAQANGQLTNCGLYGGGNASLTAGSGSLYTHALSTYNKLNGVAISCDYIINVQ